MREVDICICTYQRASLVDTLRSLDELSVPADCRLRLVVADNDLTPSAKALVEGLSKTSSFPVTYVHAPYKNISVARNACLDHATADLIAFIDDDLLATKNWVSSLLEQMDKDGADAVFGPVVAEYPDEAAGWLKAGAFHSIRPVVLPDGSIRTGYTCNVLMKRKLVAGRRFSEKLGITGGEDTLFFHDAWKSGARFAFAPDAILREQIVASRLNLPWLLRRSFRSGQTHARIVRERHGAKATAMVVSAAKVIYCAVGTLLLSPLPHRWRASLVRGALHAGTFAALVGIDDLEIYR